MKLTLTSFLTFLAFLGFAQERAGFVMSNYSLTEALRFNPASAVDGKNYLDIQFLGGAFYGSNDYIYYDHEETSLLRGIFPYATSDNYTKDPKNGQIDFHLFAPSAVYLHNDWSFGIQTGVRNYTNVDDMPWHLAKFAKEGFNYRDQWGQAYSSNPFNINYLGWSEVGLQVGKILYMNKEHVLQGGLTVRRMWGMGSSSFQVDNFDYTVVDDTLMVIEDLDMTYGITDPGLNRGQGWGFDFGLVYQRKFDDTRGYIPHSSRSACRYYNYWYKIGLGVMDVGRINLDDASYYRRLEDVEFDFYGYQDYRPSDFVDLAQYLDQVFGVYQVEADTVYSMQMPTAITGFFDYNFQYGFYVGINGSYGIPKKQVMSGNRASFIAVVPRFESSRFEFALPMKYDEFDRFGVGANLRIGFFSIGTENLLSWFFDTDLYGLDGYFHIKLSRNQRPECIGSPAPEWDFRDCSGPSIMPPDFFLDKQKKKDRNRRSERIAKKNKRRLNRYR